MCADEDFYEGNNLPFKTLCHCETNEKQCVKHILTVPLALIQTLQQLFQGLFGRPRDETNAPQETFLTDAHELMAAMSQVVQVGSARPPVPTPSPHQRTHTSLMLVKDPLDAFSKLFEIDIWPAARIRCYLF